MPSPPAAPTPLPTIPTAELEVQPVEEVVDTPEAAKLAPTATKLAITPTSEFIPETPDYHACSPGSFIFPGHFYLERPIGPENRDYIDTSYRYASTRKDTLDPHHGVEFINSRGTPVLTAAEGNVVVAGSDEESAYGPYLGFYGQLVVIEHDFPALGQPLYTLYGHLSEVLVEAGEQVESGQEIGLVGATGWAEGSHLHFEVRLGENSYAYTRNPELWLEPHVSDEGEERGGLAGYVLDKEGELVYLENMVIDYLPDEGEEDVRTVFLETYASDTLNSDDQWGENFVLGDIPPGRYRLAFILGHAYERVVEVLPGKLTVVAFCLDDR